MNYRHAYHAGNFSDVFKHLVILSLIECLQKKQTPICCFETHAGRGLYDLQSIEADKTKEYQNGIGKILELQNAPLFVKKYLNWVKSFFVPSSKSRVGCAKRSTAYHFKRTVRFEDSAAPCNLKKIPFIEQKNTVYFLGTPLLALAHLRSSDRLILAELHPEEYQALKRLFQKHKQVAVHHINGYQALRAFLPPKEKRGLVLIDPPYEVPNEITLLKQGLEIALKKWPGAIYAIWYPITERAYTQRLKNTLANLPVQNQLNFELMVSPHLPLKLNGCGMWIINPPWQFEKIISTWFCWLKKAL